MNGARGVRGTSERRVKPFIEPIAVVGPFTWPTAGVAGPSRKGRLQLLASEGSALRELARARRDEPDRFLGEIEFRGTNREVKS